MALSSWQLSHLPSFRKRRSRNMAGTAEAVAGRMAAGAAASTAAEAGAVRTAAGMRARVRM